MLFRAEAANRSKVEKNWSWPDAAAPSAPGA
jgi:hypothetical protein